MLVDYPDSSSESDLENTSHGNPARKRKAETQLSDSIARSPPPLPPTFHSLYTTAARTSTSDDPSLHAGRTRQIPHVVGHWSTHVYLEWYPPSKEVVFLSDIIRQAAFKRSSTGQTSDTKPSIHTFLRSDLGALLPLHISLSAPLVLRTEQKNLFQQSLVAQLEKLHITPFAVTIAGLDWVSNHDNTRFFLVLRLSQPEDDQLNKLLNVCNQSARQFSLAQLYVDKGSSVERIDKNHKMQNCPGKFHISVAWTLQKPTGDVAELSQTVRDHCQDLRIKFDCIKLKIGNTVLDISLDKGDRSAESIGLV